MRFDPPESMYWIYNNLEYIHVLEFGLFPTPVKKGTRIPGGGYEIRSEGGFSKQAPGGMVRLAIADLETEIQVLVGKAS